MSPVTCLRTRRPMSSRNGNARADGVRQGDLLDRMYSVAVHLAGDRPRAERAVERAYASTDPAYEGDKRRIALYRALLSSLRDERGRSATPRTGTPVVDAVHALPEADRVPVLLTDVEGLSSQQVATVLGEPADEVRDAVARAHLRLFDALSAADGGPFRPVARDGDRRADGSSRPARPVAPDGGRAGR